MATLIFAAGGILSLVGVFSILGALWYANEARKDRVQSGGMSDERAARREMHVLHSVAPQFGVGLFALLLGVSLLTISYVCGG